MKPWEERPADLDPRWLFFAASTVVLAAVFAPAEPPAPSHGAPGAPVVHADQVQQKEPRPGR